MTQKKRYGLDSAKEKILDMGWAAPSILGWMTQKKRYGLSRKDMGWTAPRKDMGWIDPKKGYGLDTQGKDMGWTAPKEYRLERPKSCQKEYGPDSSKRIWAG